jgi:transcriptional regulator CtsR
VVQVGITDVIAQFLREGLAETDDGVLEVQRNDLAQRFNCVPSQINYVVSTRFSPEHGYIVESRRGGNGYIRITRVRVNRETLMMHTLNSLGDEVDFNSARAILSNLVAAEALDESVGRTLLVALGDRALLKVPRSERDGVRADLMKQVLIHCAR